jgi:predicted dehydrogenase
MCSHKKIVNKVRLVVAGAGTFGQEHLRTLTRIEDVELVGVADLNAVTAKRSAELYFATRWSVNAPELVDELRPDGLIVATPGDTHVALATCALALGISVLVEKPVAPTMAQADLLARAERASEAFALPGHILRFSEPHRTFVQIARSDEIGPILSVTARRHRDDSHALRYPDIDPMLMTMIHDIDLAVWITEAKAVEVFAIRSPTGLQRSQTFVTARDSKGAAWHLATAWTFPGEAPADRIEVVGERGSVELEVGSHIRQHGAVTRQIDLPQVALDEPLRIELRYFVHCIRSAERPRVVTLRDAITGLAVAEAAIASLQTGAGVRP